MSKHALFSFSKLPMLKLCPHWVGGLKTPISERGSEIHERIQQAFMEDLQLEGAEGWAVEKIKEIYHVSGSVLAETELPISTSIPYVSGMADLVFFNSEGDMAIAIELKTGWGERGHCRDSLQIKAIALGLLERGYDMVSGWLIEVDKGSATHQVYTKEDMDALRQEILAVIASAVQPTGYRTGNHCVMCAKSVVCPEIEKSVTELEKISQAIEEVKNLPPSQVAERLNEHYEKALIIEKYIKALKGRAMAIIEAGGEVPGWYIKETAGVRSWTDELEASWAISEAYPDASLYTLKSPAQIEQELKKFAKTKDIKELLGRLTTQGVKRSLEKKNKEGNND